MIELIPFEKTITTEKFHVHASFLQKSPFEVHVEFHLKGPMNEFLCPSPEEPLRQDNLWKSTCLEAFMGQKNASYLEINCSPSGHWNAYEFTSYRIGSRPCDHITVRLTRLEKEADEARFFLQVISEKEFAISHIGLAMVFESTKHEKSYWALHHPSSVPDFHDANGWTLSATH